MPEDVPQPPRRTQRLGSYAVAVDTGDDRVERILLTRISSTGFPPGWWTLPGGGVDHGESPHDSLRRELYEEAGLEARTARLVDVHHVHLVEPGRDDMYEDYHGVHLLYAVEVDPSIEPHVTEIDGSTDLAVWVPVSEVGTVYAPILPMVEHVLERLDQYRSRPPAASQ